MVKTSELGASMIKLSAVSRHCDEHEYLPGITLSELLGDLIAVDSRQADIEKDHFGLMGNNALAHRKPIKGLNTSCPSALESLRHRTARVRALPSTTKILQMAWCAT